MEETEAVLDLTERYGDRDAFFALNTSLSALRLSRDLDLFHDTGEAESSFSSGPGE